MKVPRQAGEYGSEGEYQKHYDIAGALFRQDKLEEALEEYDKAIKLNPNHSWSHGNRAIVLEFQGRYEEALEAIDRALALDPEDEDFLHTKEAIFEKMEQIKEESPASLGDTLLDALYHFDGPKALWAIRVGADPMRTDVLGNTPLHLLSRCPDLSLADKIARELVARGADVNARNGVGDTPWVKLQGVPNQEHRETLSRVLEELGATRDEAGLRKKWRRMASGHFVTRNFGSINYDNRIPLENMIALFVGLIFGLIVYFFFLSRVSPP